MNSSCGQLVSLGSINMDFQVRVERWPQPSETLIGRDFLKIGGGKGANVAFIARRFGAEACLIGHVGDDALADEALAGVAAAGADLQVARVPGAATGVAMIAVRPDGEKSIVLAPNANDVWRAEEAEHAAASLDRAPAGSVLVADLEVPRFVVEGAVQAARARDFVVVLDPSPAERAPRELFPLIDFITPNQSEASLLTGRRIESPADALEAGRLLLEWGVRVALVKLGTGACVVMSREEQFVVSGFRVEVVDKTGAGDAFAGALGVALLERMPLKQATEFAVATANLTVTRYGSQPAYPARHEVEALVSRRTDG